MTTDENKEIARRAFEALMMGDLAVLGELATPNAMLHQCGFLEGIPVRSLISRNFAFQSRLAGRQVQIERMIGEGDLVAIHWQTAGHYEEPASHDIHGTPVSFPSMSFLRFEDGRIAEIWNIQDTSTLQSQLNEAAHPVGSA